jgi:hypothetical protein
MGAHRRERAMGMAQQSAPRDERCTRRLPGSKLAGAGRQLAWRACEGFCCRACAKPCTSAVAVEEAAALDWFTACAAAWAAAEAWPPVMAFVTASAEGHCRTKSGLAWRRQR